MKKPIDLSTIPDAVLHSEVARRRAAKRTTYGGGRPRSADRCPCGAMTRKRAEARGRSHDHDPTCPYYRERAIIV